ncbi:MAG: hypothetical protein AAB091_05265, partial [Elusimicrobiota bacterium]
SVEDLAKHEYKIVKREALYDDKGKFVGWRNFSSDSIGGAAEATASDGRRRQLQVSVSLNDLAGITDPTQRLEKARQIAARLNKERGVAQNAKSRETLAKYLAESSEFTDVQEGQSLSLHMIETSETGKSDPIYYVRRNNQDGSYVEQVAVLSSVKKESGNINALEVLVPTYYDKNGKPLEKQAQGAGKNVKQWYGEDGKKYELEDFETQFDSLGNNYKLSGTHLVGSGDAPGSITVEMLNSRTEQVGPGIIDRAGRAIMDAEIVGIPVFGDVSKAAIGGTFEFLEDVGHAASYAGGSVYRGGQSLVLAGASGIASLVGADDASKELMFGADVAASKSALNRTVANEFLGGEDYMLRRMSPEGREALQQQARDERIQAVDAQAFRMGRLAREQAYADAVNNPVDTKGTLRALERTGSPEEIINWGLERGGAAGYIAVGAGVVDTLGQTSAEMLPFVGAVGAFQGGVRTLQAMDSASRLVGAVAAVGEVTGKAAHWAMQSQFLSGIGHNAESFSIAAVEGNAAQAIIAGTRIAADAVFVAAAGKEKLEQRAAKKAQARAQEAAKVAVENPHQALGLEKGSNPTPEIVNQAVERVYRQNSAEALAGKHGGADMIPSRAIVEAQANVVKARVAREAFEAQWATQAAGERQAPGETASATRKLSLRERSSENLDGQKSFLRQRLAEQYPERQAQVDRVARDMIAELQSNGKISEATLKQYKQDFQRVLNTGEIRLDDGTSVKTLKEGQRQVYEEFLDHLGKAKSADDVNRLFVKLGTGGGKTLTAAGPLYPIIEAMAATAGAKKVVWSAPNELLLEQAKRDIAAHRGGRLPKNLEFKTHADLIAEANALKSGRAKEGAGLKDSYLVIDEFDAPFIEPAISEGRHAGAISKKTATGKPNPVYKVLSDMAGRADALAGNKALLEGKGKMNLDGAIDIQARQFAKRFTDIAKDASQPPEVREAARKFADQAIVSKELMNMTDTALNLDNVLESYKVDKQAGKITPKTESGAWSPTLDIAARRYLEIRHGLDATIPYEHGKTSTINDVVRTARGTVGLSATEPTAIKGSLDRLGFKRVEVKQGQKTAEGQIKKSDAPVFTDTTAQKYTQLADAVQQGMTADGSLQIVTARSTREARFVKNLLRRNGVPEGEISSILSGKQELSGNAKAQETYNESALKSGKARVLILEAPVAGRGITIEGHKNYTNVKMHMLDPHNLPEVFAEQVMGRVKGNRFPRAEGSKDLVYYADAQSLARDPYFAQKAGAQGLAKVTPEVYMEGLGEAQRRAEVRAVERSGIKVVKADQPNESQPRSQLAKPSEGARLLEEMLKESGKEQRPAEKLQPSRQNSLEIPDSFIEQAKANARDSPLNFNRGLGRRRDNPTTEFGFRTKSQTIEAAHLVGRGEIGADGINPAAIGNYAVPQIMQKTRILRAGGIDRDERRSLMRTGRVGDQPSRTGQAAGVEVLDEAHPSHAQKPGASPSVIDIILSQNLIPETQKPSEKIPKVKFIHLKTADDAPFHSHVRQGRIQGYPGLVWAKPLVSDRDTLARQEVERTNAASQAASSLQNSVISVPRAALGVIDGQTNVLTEHAPGIRLASIARQRETVIENPQELAAFKRDAALFIEQYQTLVAKTKFIHGDLYGNIQIEKTSLNGEPIYRFYLIDWGNSQTSGQETFFTDYSKEIANLNKWFFADIGGHAELRNRLLKTEHSKSPIPARVALTVAATLAGESPAVAWSAKSPNSLKTSPNAATASPVPAGLEGYWPYLPGRLDAIYAKPGEPEFIKTFDESIGSRVRGEIVRLNGELRKNGVPAAKVEEFIVDVEDMNPRDTRPAKRRAVKAMKWGIKISASGEPLDEVIARMTQGRPVQQGSMAAYLIGQAERIFDEIYRVIGDKAHRPSKPLNDWDLRRFVLRSGMQVVLVDAVNTEMVAAQFEAERAKAQGRPEAQGAQDIGAGTQMDQQSDLSKDRKKGNVIIFNDNDPALAEARAHIAQLVAKRQQEPSLAVPQKAIRPEIDEIMIPGGASLGAGPREKLVYDPDHDPALRAFAERIFQKNSSGIGHAVVRALRGSATGDFKETPSLPRQKRLFKEIYKAVVNEVPYNIDVANEISKNNLNKTFFVGECIGVGGVCRMHGLLIAGIADIAVKKGLLEGRALYSRRSQGHRFAGFEFSDGSLYVADAAQKQFGPIEKKLFWGYDDDPFGVPATDEVYVDEQGHRARQYRYSDHLKRKQSVQAEPGPGSSTTISPILGRGVAATLAVLAGAPVEEVLRTKSQSPADAEVAEATGSDSSIPLEKRNSGNNFEKEADQRFFELIRSRPESEEAIEKEMAQKGWGLKGLNLAQRDNKIEAFIYDEALKNSSDPRLMAQNAQSSPFADFEGGDQPACGANHCGIDMIHNIIAAQKGLAADQSGFEQVLAAGEKIYGRHTIRKSGLNDDQVIQVANSIKLPGKSVEAEKISRKAVFSAIKDQGAPAGIGIIQNGQGRYVAVEHIFKGSDGRDYVAFRDSNLTRDFSGNKLPALKLPLEHFALLVDIKASPIMIKVKNSAAPGAQPGLRSPVQETGDISMIPDLPKIYHGPAQTATRVYEPREGWKNLAQLTADDTRLKIEAKDDGTAVFRFGRNLPPGDSRRARQLQDWLKNLGFKQAQEGSIAVPAIPEFNRALERNNHMRVAFPKPGQKDMIDPQYPDRYWSALEDGYYPAFTASHWLTQTRSATKKNRQDVLHWIRLAAKLFEAKVQKVLPEGLVAQQMASLKFLIHETIFSGHGVGEENMLRSVFGSRQDGFLMKFSPETRVIYLAWLGQNADPVIREWLEKNDWTQEAPTDKVDSGRPTAQYQTFEVLSPEELKFDDNDPRIEDKMVRFVEVLKKHGFLGETRVADGMTLLRLPFDNEKADSLLEDLANLGIMVSSLRPVEVAAMLSPAGNERHKYFDIGQDEILKISDNRLARAERRKKP